MTTMTPDKVELRIPRRPEFVRVARIAASALAAQLEFTYDAIEDVKLAVGEACTNAVEHACGAESDEILVRFVIATQHLAVEVVDRGEGFDPALTAGEEVHWERAGGLGLVVIREIMDELEVICDPKTGTCVRMIKYRAKE